MIERTGPLTWRLTGVHARRAAPFMWLALIGFFAFFLVAAYYVVYGSAAALGVSPWVTGLVWLVFSFSLTVNGQRKALLPSWGATAVNWTLVSLALWYYAAHGQWQAWMLATFLLLGVVSTVRKRLKARTA